MELTIAKIIAGVVVILIAAGIIGVWKLISGKASKTDLEKLLLKFEQTVTKTDLMKDLGTVVSRADDKDLRTQRDIVELKTDLRSTTDKTNTIDKKLDEIPSRVASLETTRSRNSTDDK